MPQHRLVRILSQPKNGSLKFSLDNDVLSEILNNRNETTQFVRLLNTNDIEIHISSEVLGECNSGENKERVVSRQLNLVPILKTGKVRMLKDIRSIVRGELRHSFLPPLSPFCPEYFVKNASIHFGNSEWLQEVHGETKSDRDGLTFSKRRAHEVDRQLATKLRLRSDWDVEDILRDVRSFNGISFKLRHFEYGLDTLRMGKPDLSIRMLKHHIQRGEAKISLSLAALVNFRFLILLLGDHQTEFSHLRTTSKGAWYDVVNAASAGYCEFFVSNDGKLRDFCNSLADRKAIGFRAINYSEFVAKLARDGS